MQSDQSASKNPVRLQVDEIELGDELQIFGNVFREVIGIEPDDFYPSCLQVTTINDYQGLYHRDAIVTVLR